MNNMREEFEAWISHYIGESWLKPDPVRAGEYFDNGTQSVWESWQASRAALCVKLPENCKGMALTVDEFRDQLDTAGVGHE